MLLINEKEASGIMGGPTEDTTVVLKVDHQSMHGHERHGNILIHQRRYGDETHCHFWRDEGIRQIPRQKIIVGYPLDRTDSI